MTTQEKLSTQDTKRLLDHACCSSTNMTAAKVAEFLDVPAPRISEGRSQAWRLTAAHASKLIDKFGQPRGKPGIFVRAEERLSIDEFIDSELDYSKYRDLEKISKFYHSKHFNVQLAEKLTIIDETSLDFEGSNDDGIEAQKQHYKLGQVFALMETDEFQHWLIAAESFLDKINLIDSYQDPQDIFLKFHSITYCVIDDIGNIDPTQNLSYSEYENSIFGLFEKYNIRNDSITTIDIFNLGQLNNHFNDNGRVNRFDHAKPLMKEFIITGREIWVHESIFNEYKIGGKSIDSIFIPKKDPKHDWKYVLFRDMINLLSPMKSNELEFSVDRWTTYKVSIFLNDNCDYSLLLELGSQYFRSGDPYHYPDRHIVIPEISASQLFNELEKIRKWLTLPDLPIDNIKYKIARNGGYISGATVI